MDGYEITHIASRSMEEVPYCEISRSHWLKNRWFRSDLSKITRPVAAVKSLRIALLLIYAIISYFSLSPPNIVLCWLQAMRRYLLLGQGDFIRHLMDLLE